MRPSASGRPPAACRGVLRHLRATAVSLIALSLGVGGHMLGGGHPPTALVFLGVWALAVVVTWPATGRRLTFWTLAGVLVVVQTGMHVVSSLHPAGGHHHGSDSYGWAMFIGHAVATGIAIVVLGYGERVLWSLLETLVLRPLQVIIAAQTPRDSRSSVCIEAARHRPRVWLCAAADPARGPPMTA